MIITASWIKDDIPQTSLSPIIDIVDLSNNQVIVSGVSMTHVRKGTYKYNFSAYDNTKDYEFICDGGITMEGYGRYAYGVNDSVSIVEMEDALEDTDASIG